MMIQGCRTSLFQAVAAVVDEVVVAGKDAIGEPIVSHEPFVRNRLHGSSEVFSNASIAPSVWA
jgi:hypothetical protein